MILYFFLVIPISFIIFGGTPIYVQYRQKGGFKFGMVPYRRQSGKFKTSDDNLVPRVNTLLPSSSSPSVNRNYLLIENIGAMVHLLKEQRLLKWTYLHFQQKLQ